MAGYGNRQDRENLRPQPPNDCSGVQLYSTSSDEEHLLLTLEQKNFMEPLQKSGLIRNDEKSKLFSNVNLIVGVNQTLLHQLEERVSDWSFETCLGDVFLTLVHGNQEQSGNRPSSNRSDLFLQQSPYLIMYTTYISNYTQAMETYQRLQQQPAFANMITVAAPRFFKRMDEKCQLGLRLEPEMQGNIGCKAFV